MSKFMILSEEELMKLNAMLIEAPYKYASPVINYINTLFAQQQEALERKIAQDATKQDKKPEETVTSEEISSVMQAVQG